ncbi:HIT family protein [bacterium]|nr:HIT family protein [bacterium]
MTVFDDIPESEYVSCSSAFFVVRDRFPVSEGHSLIISRRQDAVTYFDLSSDEKQELLQLIEQVKAALESELSPDGYNIGMNCGDAAGQTVMRFHCHVIPRFNGDMDDPRGGVRLCIPSKGNYLREP